jgi:hypothetical protein
MSLLSTWNSYFEDVCKVIDRASNNRTKAVRMKNPKTMLLFGVLMNKYRNQLLQTV